jgi:hypothetical protein
MSDLKAQNADENPPLLARFEDLFTETGIAINDTTPHLVLHIADSKTEPPLPTTAIKPPRKKGLSFYFETFEHMTIGNDVLLRFSEDDVPKRASDIKLHLVNGLALTYGQVLALGGDFYGIADRPICDGTTGPDRRSRFIAAFNSLGVLPSSVAEVAKILDVAQKEANAVAQAIRDGKEAEQAYAALGDTLSEEWNRITGGGSVFSDLFPLGRYLKLAANNADHFGHWAILAYIAGHGAALQHAATAHASQDRKILEQAYAMNAFADHFLTDLFASGHLRVPRKELAEQVTPGDLGSLISRFMHDEDNKYGLKVRNSLGEQWRAYGDKRYFDLLDEARFPITLAVQASADEVFSAYASGTALDERGFTALQHLPDLNAVLTPASNFSPLFRLEGDKVLRRKDVNNLNDTATVDDWWGWSTYLLLKDYKPTGNTN